MRRGSRADILRRTLAIAPDRRTTYMPNSDQGTTVMNGPTDSTTARPWKEILMAFFKLGATSYGGPAMMGIMQAELQAKRNWVSKERFVEGLAVANMVPGATATQLAIFLAYERGGLWAGLLGGLCFVLPGFVIMLGLAITYAGLGLTPIARGALYGLGPVVIGLFAVALYRLGRSAASTKSEMSIAVIAAIISATTPLGIVAVLVLAGGRRTAPLSSSNTADQSVGNISTLRRREPRRGLPRADISTHTQTPPRRADATAFRVTQEPEHRHRSPDVRNSTLCTSRKEQSGSAKLLSKPDQ